MQQHVHTRPDLPLYHTAERAWRELVPCRSSAKQRRAHMAPSNCRQCPPARRRRRGVVCALVSRDHARRVLQNQAISGTVPNFGVALQQLIVFNNDLGRILMLWRGSSQLGSLTGPAMSTQCNCYRCVWLPRRSRRTRRGLRQHRFEIRAA